MIPVKKQLIGFLLLFQAAASILSAGTWKHSGYHNMGTSDTLNMKVLVPAYFDPSGSDYWDRMAAVSAEKPGSLYAIANKDNGPGSSYDASYASAINKMHNNGGCVIGYVYTNYGAIPESTVKSDIDKWYSWYPSLDGIFLDCQDNVAGKENYYINIYKHIKQKDSTSLVVSNPGTNTIENYLIYGGQRVSDVDCIYELNTGFDSWTPSAWCSKYPGENFYAIPYSITADEYKSVVDRAHALNMGWIYCTNDVLPNPYDTLPPYFEKFCSYVFTGVYTPDSTKTVINIDGKFNDWQNVAKLNIPPNPAADSGDTSDPNADYINFWAANDTSTLYLSCQVAGSISSNYFYHIFIDADENVNTGYIYKDSASVGAELMVENDNLWKYTGKGGSDWGWSQVSGFVKANTGGRTEMSIPLSAIHVSGSNTLRIIFQVNSSVSPYTLMEIDPVNYTNQYYTYKINTVTGIDEKSSSKKLSFGLNQNYPNPFNPSTVISYNLKEKSAVTLKIYNMLGREITTLVNKVQPAGEYSVAFNPLSKGMQLPSGIYFYKLQAGIYSAVKKMILIK